MNKLVKIIVFLLAMSLSSPLAFAGKGDMRKSSTSKFGQAPPRMIANPDNGNTWDPAIQTVRVSAAGAGALIVVGCGVYYGCDFMTVSANDAVDIKDAATVAASAAIGYDSNLCLLDKANPTAKGPISQYIANGIAYSNGLVVSTTDNDVDGNIYFQPNA